MEKFTVNGREVEFDIFDLDVMDAYLAGLEKVDSERRVKQENEGVTDTLRRICITILDFFDDMLGEGKAEELFGQKINSKAIFEGYKEFTSQVNGCVHDYSKDLNTAAAAPAAVNRAQRREAQRRRA